MNQRLASVAAAVVMLCSIAATALYARHALTERRVAGPTVVTNTTRFVPGADRERSIGTRIGPIGAPVTIVEFTDLQCPACRSLDLPVRALRERWPTQLAVVYRHFPLERIHPHARAAAEAWECAGAQGRFDAFAREAYAAQDSFGLVRWTELAARAGVQDTASFARCVTTHQPGDRVADDVATAERLGFVGTPTFVIGDSAYAGRSLLALDSLVRATATRSGVTLP